MPSGIWLRRVSLILWPLKILEHFAQLSLPAARNLSSISSERSELLFLVLLSIVENESDLRGLSGDLD